MENEFNAPEMQYVEFNVENDDRSDNVILHEPYYIKWKKMNAVELDDEYDSLLDKSYIVTDEKIRPQILEVLELLRAYINRISKK